MYWPFSSNNFFLIYSFQNRIPNYLLINGTVSGDDSINVLVTQEELDILYRNKYLYFNNRKVKYHLKSVIRDALVRDGNYHYVVISFKIDNKYKINDSISVVIGDGKISFYKIFKSMWEGV